MAGRASIPIVVAGLYEPVNALGSLAPASLEMEMPNADAHTALAIRNMSGGPATITIHTWCTVASIPLPHVVFTMAHDPDNVRFIGPFLPRVFNAPNTQLMWVDFSRVNSVTVAGFRVAPI